MLNYMWDLGFNWESILNSDGKTYFLETGLVAFPANVVASSGLALPQNSSFGFHLFNTTPAGMTGSGSDCTIQTLTINFRANLVGQKATSPFNDSSNNYLTVISPTLTVVPAGASTIMGVGPFTCWYFGSYTAVNPGQFKFTVSVNIQGPDGNGGTTTKTFVEDPEMIVGGTN